MMEDTSFQKVLADLPDDEKIAVFELAHKYGIPEGDPVWHEVLLVRESVKAKTASCDAAQAAGEAADRLRDELRGLPEKLKEGATSGAAEVRASVQDAGVESGNQVKEAAFEAGKAIIAAMANEGNRFAKKLEDEAAKKKESIIADWRDELATAARKNESIRAWKWLAIGAAAMIIGISGAYLAGAQNGPVFGPMAESWHGFINCEEPGWKIKELEDGSYCFPHPAADGVHGWRIP